MTTKLKLYFARVFADTDASNRPASFSEKGCVTELLKDLKGYSAKKSAVKGYEINGLKKILRKTRLLAETPPIVARHSARYHPARPTHGSNYPITQWRELNRFHRGLCCRGLF